MYDDPDLELGHVLDLQLHEFSNDVEEICDLAQKEEKMETGKVKFYNREKRYGFVTGDDGTDYFFHESMLAEGQQVRDEDKVEFNATDGDRGKQATDISRID